MAGVLERLPDWKRKVLPLAQDIESYGMLQQGLELLPQELDQEIKQEIDLLFGPGPIFPGKSVQGHILKTASAAGGHDFFDCIRTSLMPGASRQPFFFSPATVSVHDDRQVSDELSHTLFNAGRPLLGHNEFAGAADWPSEREDLYFHDFLFFFREQTVCFRHIGIGEFLRFFLSLVQIVLSD